MAFTKSDQWRMFNLHYKNVIQVKSFDIAMHTAVTSVASAAHMAVGEVVEK
jgi:hypothetical protein